MCSDQQFKYIMHLAKTAGVSVDKEKIKGFSSDEASKFIDGLKDKADCSVVSEENGTPKKASGINNVRLGLAVKLILQQKRIGYATMERNDFCNEVKELYDAIQEAEAFVASSLGGDNDVAK